MLESRVWRAVYRAVGMAAIGTMLSTGTTPGATLRAGLAKVDITPPPGATMWGYSNRPGPGESTLDPLYAGVLVLSDGTATVALVTLDLGRVFMDDYLERIRTAAAKAGVQTVLIAASHTHHAPSVEIRDWPSKDNPWVDGAVEKVIKAVVEAAADLHGVQIAVGYGEIDQAHNRRHVGPDGTVLMRWRNAKREPTQPVDKTVGVLRIDDEDGKVMAVLVNYACHPVVMGPDNMQYSADYVGVMRKTVEESLGAQCLFLQGACGNINPYMDKTPLSRDGLKRMTEMGRTLGAEVIRVTRDIKPELDQKPSVKVKTSRLRLEPRWHINDPKVREAILARYKDYIRLMGEAAFLKYLERFTNPMDVTSTTFLISDRIACVGFPGEFFVEFQQQLRRMSPARHTFFIGYADGFAAYFPTIRAAAEGGYGAGYQTFVEVGAGERMVNEAVVNIYELLGKLGKAPALEVPDYPGQLDD
jgi:neutral ceramidase